MTVATAWTGTADSRAAVTFARAERDRRADRLVVVVSAEAGTEAQVMTDLGSLGIATDDPSVEVRSVPAGSTLSATLIDVSYEDDVEVLVIGLKRRTPVGKLVMGSTSQQVILEAGCAVTGVKAPVGSADA
jgi:nucleotide-binding universal stress UspA family protein